jgi:4,5-DOPA dioxygenase extradiol
MTLNEFTHLTEALLNSPRMPALFVGHGSPMNGIEDTVFARGWKTLGETLPRPAAILAISAHWLTKGTFVHIAEKPKTIHDFWGFPKELYDITYPCPGAPAYAKALQTLVSKTRMETDLDWGIDHGTWIVLHRMFPLANIPVFQMSIDMSKSGQFHYELGRKLAALREKGVLIMGSGNIVHNLGRIDFNEDAKTFDWVEEFDTEAKMLIEKGDHASLINHEALGHAAALAIPTPDHYWPLLYALGLQEKNEAVSFPIEGITHGSISMRSVLIK